MEYKNVKTVKNRICSCRTWLQHWMINTNSRSRPTCSVYFCGNKATLGGIVRRCQDKDDAIFVTPLCPQHYPYHFQDCFKIKKDKEKVLVSVNNPCRESN